MPTFAGNPLTLNGKQLNINDKAPNFKVLNGDLEEVSFDQYKDKKVKVISSVPSLDTPVCDQQTRRLNEELSKQDDVVVLTISNDLPFAQARWCGSAGLDNVITLSDYRDLDFANHYGTLLNELRLQTRAVFVVDQDNTIQHVEYVDEITNHPNYDVVIKKVKELL